MLGMSYVEDVIYISSGIGKVKEVGRWYFPFGGMGVVLDRWGGGGPWFGGSRGCPWWVACVLSLLGGVSRPRGPASPLDGCVFPLVSIYLALARLAFCLKK